MTFGYGSGISGVSFGATSPYSTTGAVSYEHFFDTEYSEKKWDYREQENQRENAYNAKNSAIDSKVDEVVYYLSNGREDLTLQVYNQLIEEIAVQNPGMSDSQIMGHARTKIEAVLSAASDNPVTLVSYIKEKAADVNEQATQKVLYYDDCVDKCTEEDLLLVMCGTTEEKKQSSGNKWKNGFLNFITLGCLSELFCGVEKR